MATEQTVKSGPLVWRRCNICRQQTGQAEKFFFKSPREFSRHLRDFHCTREGGSFICRYGPHGVCPTLPVEGVSDRDYEDHLIRVHLSETGNKMGSEGNNRSNSHSPTPVAASISSEPSVVQDQHKWTVYMSKVNLPAALNDPRLARRETDIFTKTWGEGFEKFDTKPGPSPHLPEIGREHFKKYLKKTGSRYKEHSKVCSQLSPQQSSDEADPAHEFPLLHARKLADRSRAELEAIPKLFMLSNFSLENPDTFNAVFPWTQIESGRQDSSGKQRQSSKLLQEKLSHYLDLVEVQIARQISLQSEAFFQAMSSHDKLQENMANTCQSIKELRHRIQDLDKSQVQGPLQILKKSRTRSNYVKLHNKLKMMATVHQTQPTIQLLLATNEFVGALDLIATTQEVLTQELAGVHSFRHLGSQLTEMEKLIDKMMQGDFVRYATTDLNRPLNEDASVLEEEAGTSEAQERLVAIIFGMLRQRRFNFIDIYKEEAFTAIKTIVKTTVIEAVAEADDIDTEGTVGSLADQMRLLNYPQWMNLLKYVFHNQVLQLQRIKAVVSSMLDVVQVAAGNTIGDTHLDSSGSELASSQDAKTDEEMVNGKGDAHIKEEESVNHINGSVSHRNATLIATSGAASQVEEVPPPSPTAPLSPIRMSVSNEDTMISHPEQIKVTYMLKDLLCQCCDQAHDRCVKLLVARAKDGFLERLSSSEFVTLSREIETFVSDCESICGRKSTSLRGCLQSQANRFVNRFHEERKTKLTLILDNERWKQADVPAEFQDLVNHIITSGELSLPEKKFDSDKRPQEFIHVNGQRYAVVGTVLMLLKMVVEYCNCVDDIPTATPDILTRLIELLKMFNSRTCQLILGAGALKLVGLKTITTKNLALASRCLQLVLYFLPQVRQHFTDRLQGKQTNMLKHFEHILKDYTDHVAEIGNKLVAIMEIMLDMYLSKYEVKPPMPSSSFRNICKQMSKLHEAITDLLPPDQVQELFRRVHESFKIYLRGQLMKLGVTNDGSPQHGLVMADIAFYSENLKSLTGLVKLGDNIEDIWDKR